MQRRYLLLNPLAENPRPFISQRSIFKRQVRGRYISKGKKSLSKTAREVHCTYSTYKYIQYSIFGVIVYLYYVLTSPTSYCYHVRLRTLPPSLKQYLYSWPKAEHYLPTSTIHYTIQYTLSYILSSHLLLIKTVFFSKQLFSSSSSSSAALSSNRKHCRNF